MDLLKHYGAKELARMTYRDVTDRKKKRERDVNSFIADRVRTYYSGLNDSRRKAKIW